MSRVTLACGSPNNASSSLEEARHRAEVWFEPFLCPFFTVELWRYHFVPLCLSVVSEIYMKCVLVTWLTRALWIISTWTRTDSNSDTMPSPDAGRLRVTGPTRRLHAVLVTQGDGIQAFLSDLRGSSKPLSVAVSKCVFASRCPCVLTCQHLFPLRARGRQATCEEPLVWRSERCIDYCYQDCVVWNNHLHKFYMHSTFPFICQVNICKSYTHTNEIIIMITNIFFPCFIAWIKTVYHCWIWVWECFSPWLEVILSPSVNIYDSPAFQSSIFQSKNRTDDIFTALILWNFMPLVGCVIKTNKLWHSDLAV